MNGQRFYTFKKGNVRFFALDTDYLDPEQVAWLDKELGAAAKTDDWKICYFHHPLYSSGAFHGPSLEIRKVLEPMFVKYGVNVVISGHDHVYERIKPQKGIYYFLEGASGELRPGNLKKTDITAAGFDKDRSFLTMEISGDELFFQTISRTGATVDSGTIQKGALPGPTIGPAK